MGTRCAASCSIDCPEDLSPQITDLQRRWYTARGLSAERLLIESFVVLDPVAALRSSSVPYWSMFSVEPSVRRLAAHLDGTAPYEEVLALLFPHGTTSVGLAGPEQWRHVLNRAQRCGRLLAVDARRFPADFAHFTRHGPTLDRLRPFVPLPDEPLTLRQLKTLAPGLLDDAGPVPRRATPRPDHG